MEFVSSFAGAAFAFGFFLIGQAVLRGYERRKAHYDSLVYLERLLNVQLDQVHLVRRQSGQVRSAVEQGRLPLALPGRIPEAEGLYIDLLDLGITNALIDSGVSIGRVNRDLESLRRGYDTLAGRYLDGGFSLEAYVANGGFFADRFDELAVELEHLASDILDVLTRIRLRLKEPRRLSDRLVARLSRVKERPIEPGTLIEERRKLDAEIEECAARSGGRTSGARPNKRIDADSPRASRYTEV